MEIVPTNPGYDSDDFVENFSTYSQKIQFPGHDSLNRSDQIIKPEWLLLINNFHIILGDFYFGWLNISYII